MPKNIPGIVKRSRKRPGEKVRIMVQPNPYPLEQPGGQANVSGPMNPQMQQGMQPNVSGPMNPQMQQGMQPNVPVPMNPQMQQGGPGPMPQPMQPGSSQPLMQQGGSSMTSPASMPGQVMPMQSNGQWRGDPNMQPQGGNHAWQGGAGAPNGMPPQQSPTPYNNQPWPANSAPMTPPQMPNPFANQPAYNNNMPMQQGRHTPPPASNIPSQPLAQPGQAHAAPRNPSQPIGNPQYSPVMSATPAAAPPTSAPSTPSNSGLLGRPGPRSLSGIVDAPTISAPLPHIFVEIDGKMVQEVQLDKPVLTVGRQDGRDIQIRHQSISRTHARILNERGTWFVEDAGSVNGIVSNGQRVHRVAINNGDRVFVAPNIALLYRII